MKLAPSMTTTTPNPKNNIILMTDGYKFSHHKQYPVSWMPNHAKPASGGTPPILYPSSDDKSATRILKLFPVPTDVTQKDRVHKITIVTNVSTAVVTVEPATGDADIDYTGQPVVYAGGAKPQIVIKLSDAERDRLLLPATHGQIKFENVDESKLKRGSALNENFDGGYNVSYFTPRAYSDMFEDLEGDNIVFFGLQYFVKEYLTGQVVTKEKIDEAEGFIARYMADVRIADPDNYANGYDFTMFPRGDWEAMESGDHDAVGTGKSELAGVLPIKIEALPEGSTIEPGVCCFKITNTHPRFFWLPNFLETLLVQVWYPMTVATQAREFRKTIQAYSILSQRESQMPSFLGPAEFNLENCADDQLAIHIAQVFDLLDFGYRGVSSHETASLGSAAYYTTGFEGSDTVAGSRMLLRYYNYKKDANDISYQDCFERFHGGTSVPAAEHSTITSWADVSPDADYKLYEAAEYNAFTNMIKQYMPSFAVSLVSDGFNIWNAIAFLWTSKDTSNGGDSMFGMLERRLKSGQLTLIRPDSGEGFETLPQYMSLLNLVLPDHWQAEDKDLRPVFPDDADYEARYKKLVERIQAKVEGKGEGKRKAEVLKNSVAEALKNSSAKNPFRRFTGQQLRVLQGDGVALDTVGDMLASLLANGFCANTVHFGSGGGLLQKLNRDSLSVAFKCCAMYVGGKNFPVGKDPIAGGKKSYGGNPAVIRGEDGVLRNRGEYDKDGKMLKAVPMTVDEFENGAAGDELKCIYKNGEVTLEQNFNQVKVNAKIKNVKATLKKAVDNLELKMDFFQQMASDKTLAIRLAEASTGSKWGHKHETKLANLKETYPKFAGVFDELGFTNDMDSHAVMKHINDKYVCEKKTKKAIMAALGRNDPEGANKAMGEKLVVTL